MKTFFTFTILILSIKSYTQKSDTINLADFKLCELTVDFLKQKDSNLKIVKVEEMNLCSDEFIQDGRFENRIGYMSNLYPGVVFKNTKPNHQSSQKFI